MEALQLTRSARRPGSRLNTTHRNLSSNIVEHVFAATTDSFQADVLERSRQTPVLLLFWADQVPPSADIKRRLEAMVGGYGGKALLGTVDVAQDQTLAQHMRVQALPSIRVIDNGQIVQQLDGPQPEEALRALLDQLTLSSGDLVKAQIAQLLELGDFDRALAILRQAIGEEPNNMAFRVELADVLVRQGDLDGARTALSGVPADTDDRARPQTRLELAEEAAALPPRETSAATLAADSGDLEARYALAIAEAAAGNAEAALEHAMTILRTDRAFRDDIGRKTMIRIFTVLGKGNALASGYRRRMFNVMH